MSKGMHIIRTLPSKADFEPFEELPKLLYPESSPRFTLGHDPVPTHLEGLYVLLHNGQPIGRFAFYENPHLRYEGKPTACIGSYECTDDSDVATALLDHAKTLARMRGYAWLIGPMEGSTWSSYRFSTHNNAPNFFMEPYHHLYYNDQFKMAGFAPIGDYVSNLDTEPRFDTDYLRNVEEMIRREGLSIRNLDMQHLTFDLNQIANFVIEAFRHNFLYTPITPEAFVTQYLKLAKLFDPQLVLFIENAKGEIQALSFSIPDYCDPLKETIIIKSMAKRKDFLHKGIAHYQAGKTFELSQAKGYRKAVHAFMHIANPSVKLSSSIFSSEAYKAYTLYGCHL